MQEKTIYHLSLFVLIFGLGTLLYFSYDEDVSIKSLSEAAPEEDFQVQGVVTRVSVSDKAVFLEVEGERIETVDVVLFSKDKIPVQKGDYVVIKGQVEEYHGKKELIGNEVVVK